MTPAYDIGVLAMFGADLVAYWPANDGSGNLADLAGHGWVATASGSSTYEASGPTINGVAHSAVQFSGTSYFTTSGSLDPADPAKGRTLFCWVYLPSTTSSAQRILVRDQTNEREMSMSATSGGWLDCAAYAEDGNTVIANPGVLSVDGGVWNLAMAWWDPVTKDVSAQLNDDAPDTQPGTVNINSDSSVAYGIGAYANGTGPLRSGSRMCKIGILDRVITATERAALLSGVFPAATRGWSDYITGLGAAVVGWWRLGETSGTTAVDEKGTQNGVYTGTPTLGAAGSVTDDYDTAMVVNGSDQYCRINDNAAWSPTTTGGLTVIIACDPNAAAHGSFLISKGTDTQFEWEIARRNNAGVEGFGALIRQAAGTTIANADVDHATLYADGPWYLVGMTIDTVGQVVALWVGQASDATWTKVAIDNTWSGSMTNGTSEIEIGRRRDNTGDFIGGLDEALIVNQVLSDRVMGELFQAWNNTLVPRQTAHPSADVTTTGWTATPLFSKIDDGPASPDGTVVTSIPWPDYGVKLLATFPSPQFAYALESGASAAERVGSGAGVLTYANSPTYVGPAVRGSPAAGMSFNGTNQAGTATDHATHDISTNDFWLHILFNIATWPTSQQYVFCHSGNGDNGSWDLNFTNPDGRMGVRIITTSGANAEVVAAIGSAPVGWHQLVFTCDRDSATGGKYYLDGVQFDGDKNYSAAAGDVSWNGSLYVARRTAGTYIAGSFAWAAMGFGIPSQADIAAVWAAR